jgi:ABC-type lipoprotein release transport system permease subunit
MNDVATPAAGRITERAQRYLVETKPWVRFISVMIFIGAGFMVVAALAMFAFMSAGRAIGGNRLAGVVGGSIAALVYVALALLYIAPGVFLSRYASAIERIAKDGSVAALEPIIRTNALSPGSSPSRGAGQRPPRLVSAGRGCVE